MINQKLEREALELMAEHLEIPIIQLDTQRAKTFAEFGASELKEIELQFILADRFNYQAPDDRELRILSRLYQTLAYIQLNAEKRPSK